VDDLVGRSLGQYQIVQRLGEGGMATVYKAFQPSLNRYVAIKVLPPDLAQQPDFAARFTREAHAVAQLQHPHILSIHDFGQEGGLSYIVMQYVEAGTLQQRMHQPMDLETIAKIIEQLADALDYAHRRGIIHRDIKPSNVLMEDGRWPLLADFGIAKMLGGNTGLTATGIGIGTPAYMSPEQGRGQPVDARSDVYSLGVMLFEMLTGRVPFVADTPMGIVIQHILSPIPPPRSLNPAIPEAVERVIFGALAKDPNDRSASAGELAAALRKALATGDIPRFAPKATRVAPAPPVIAAPRPKRPIQWGKIVRRVAGGTTGLGILGVLLACIVVIGVTIWAVQNPDAALRTLGPIASGIQNLLSGESADGARAFADPILTDIAGREPDYAEDFSDPTSGWPVQSNSNVETKYETGGYSVLIKTADTSPDLSMDELRGFDDFVAQVDIQWISSARGNAGLLWRFEQGEPCYGGGINPIHRRWGMWSRAGAVDISGWSGYVHTEEWNRLILIVEGEDIALYVNDEPVAFASDDECLTGGVQLNVQAWEPGAHAQLDNVKVWDISDLNPITETPMP
jgi:hypothetical protein